jgi:hypothetical protein
LHSLAQHPLYEALYGDLRFEKVNRALYEGLCAGKRYRNLRLNAYASILCKERETQFAAVTFLPEEGPVFIAFRGTDETFLGWKEDFGLAYLDPIPAQHYAVKYLNLVSAKVGGEFYVGGHSKGGNLAVYAAMCCNEAAQARILQVLNLDGPGIKTPVLERCHYERIADRVQKKVPVDSVVGTLFEREGSYEMIESEAAGVMQHDLFSWKVAGPSFVYAEGASKSGMAKQKAVNDWVNALREEEAKELVAGLFEAIDASGAQDLNAFRRNKKEGWSVMKAAFSKLDPKMRREFRKLAGALLGRKRFFSKEKLRKIGRKKTPHKQ